MIVKRLSIAERGDSLSHTCRLGGAYRFGAARREATKKGSTWCTRLPGGASNAQLHRAGRLRCLPESR